MKPDWEKALTRLRAYPAGTHRILPPCPEGRLADVERSLGVLPDSLTDMLRHLNGAELFGRASPMLTLFGVSIPLPLPPLEWGPDWYIDKFTPVWRASQNRPDDWVIAITNYGGLVVLDRGGLIGEWDTAERRWIQQQVSFADWLEREFLEGEAYLRN